MNNTVQQKFKQLEARYSNVQDYKVYWPETAETYNTRDNAAFRIRSQIRSLRIVQVIKELDLPAGSKILDICCGLPILLHEIKNELPHLDVYGIDVVTDEIDDFQTYSDGCQIFKFPFQMLFDESYEDNTDFELIMMFNSFRAFDDEDQLNILKWYENNGNRFMYDIPKKTKIEILQSTNKKYN